MTDARERHPVPRHGTRSLRRIRGRLLEWYAANHRDFPWRHTRDPYAVLVSEVMLQQTQASRVAERFQAFLERFPTAAALSSAPDAQVLATWSGLGYNRRALALKRAASQVTNSGWPRTVAGLEELAGIGPYTARAVASLAFGIPTGVVDTNVRRWLVRRFGLDPLGADGAPRSLQGLADALATASSAPPGTYEVASWTHATMEFGAAVCTSRRPACPTCPIARGCPSRGRAGKVPVPRQARFAGSSRARRGAILRYLAKAPGHQLSRHELATMIGDDGHGELLERAIVALTKDGLAHASGDSVRLGSKRGCTSTAATIGP
jgi:A/G-specific adenine glycosylase